MLLPFVYSKAFSLVQFEYKYNVVHINVDKRNESYSFISVIFFIFLAIDATA